MRKDFDRICQKIMLLQRKKSIGLLQIIDKIYKAIYETEVEYVSS